MLAPANTCKHRVNNRQKNEQCDTAARPKREYSSKVQAKKNQNVGIEPGTFHTKDERSTNTLNWHMAIARLRITHPRIRGIRSGMVILGMFRKLITSDYRGEARQNFRIMFLTSYLIDRHTSGRELFLGALLWNTVK